MKKSRVFAIVVVLVISGLLLLPNLVAGLEWTTLEESVLFAVGMLALVALFLINPAQQNPKAKGIRQEAVDVETLTSFACHQCDFTDQREFKRGDFVGKSVGKCPKCKNDALYIRAIYTAEEKKEGKR